MFYVSYQKLSTVFIVTVVLLKISTTLHNCGEHLLCPSLWDTSIFCINPLSTVQPPIQTSIWLKICCVLCSLIPNTLSFHLHRTLCYLTSGIVVVDWIRWMSLTAFFLLRFPIPFIFFFLAVATSRISAWFFTLVMSPLSKSPWQINFVFWVLLFHIRPLPDFLIASDA